MGEATYTGALRAPCAGPRACVFAFFFVFRMSVCPIPAASRAAHADALADPLQALVFAARSDNLFSLLRRVSECRPCYRFIID